MWCHQSWFAYFLVSVQPLLSDFGYLPRQRICFVAWHFKRKDFLTFCSLNFCPCQPGYRQSIGRCRRDSSVFFKYWHEAFISEVKIPYKLHSHWSQPVQNRHSYSDSKQWQKNFVGDRARTYDLAFHDGQRWFWQHFSGLFSTLVKLLFGTIILSTDLLGPVAIIWSGCDPDQDLGLFRPKQHLPHC